MREHHRDNHGPEGELLDELIDATRAETPSEVETAAALRRLGERLASERARPVRSAWRGARVVHLLLGTPRRALGSALGLAAAVLLVIALAALPGPQGAQAQTLGGAGDLLILGADGQATGLCPLRHTEVSADLTGLVGRVTVTQTFHNPSADKIEAVYVFPLPENAAVDAMTIVVGGRRIVGKVLPRPEARAVYERAKAAGKVAGLLDQERPNVFTQSVANIGPAAEVQVEISYVQTLKYEDGSLEFVYPMVVAPRYHPAATATADAATTGTIGVPDAARITPPVAPPATRPGHDIGLTVRLDTGLKIQAIESELHETTIERPGPTTAVVTLKNWDEIPNGDFILRVETATDRIGDALLAQTDARGTFFTLILEPPKWIAPEQIVPKEMIFVIDRSGSMNGWKIEKAKAAMRACIKGLTPEDTFNLLSFSGGLGKLFGAPRPATPDNVAQALAYLDGMQSGGGTEMMPAIREALSKPGRSIDEALLRGSGVVIGLKTDQPIRGLLRRALPTGETAPRLVGYGEEGPFLVSEDGAWAIPLYDPQGVVAALPDGQIVTVKGTIDPRISGHRLTIDAIEPERVRIVGFMTDGEIGNDFEILDEVKRNAGTTRVFAFGVGDSVNRFLLQGMADLGRGAVEFVDESVAPDDAARRFFVRVHAPVLTDIGIDWGGLPVADLYPDPLPDLFSAHPVMVHGRFYADATRQSQAPTSASITLRGRTARGPFERRVTLKASTAPPQGSALASLWARAKVEHLMRRDMRALQAGTFPEDIKREITQLGVDYGLMTQFTSFVAVDESQLTAPGDAKRLDVPLATPHDEHGAALGRVGDQVSLSGGQPERGEKQRLFFLYDGQGADKPAGSAGVKDELIAAVLGRPMSQNQPAPASVAVPQGSSGVTRGVKMEEVPRIAGYDPSNGTDSLGIVRRISETAALAPPQTDATATTLTVRPGKGVEIVRRPEAEAKALAFLDALENGRWTEALAMSSPSLRKCAESYDTAEAFFRENVPVAAVIRHRGAELRWEETMRGVRTERYYFGAPMEEGNDRSWSWRWSVRWMEGDWRIDFDHVPLKILRMFQRTQKELRDQDVTRQVRLAEELGLATVLTSGKSVFAAGEPILVRLELVNHSAKQLFYNGRPAAGNYSMDVVDQNGARVADRQGGLQTVVDFKAIEPGQRVTLFEGLDLTRQYVIQAPGRYWVRYNGGGLHVGEPTDEKSKHGEPWPVLKMLDVLVRSNVVAIDVASK